MKSVLFIEDRKSRQENMLGKSGCENLKKIQGLSIIENPEEVIEQINIGNTKVLENASLIIIHKSSINQNGLITLLNYGKQEGVSIVLFSGGISSVSYINDKYELLQLSSFDLYSIRLVNFIYDYLNNNYEHLTELAYGKKWKLNFLFQYRHLLYLQDQNEDLFREDEERNNITKDDLMFNCENILGENYSIEEVDKEIKKIIAQL